MRALIADDEAPARRRLAGVLRRLPAIGEILECAGGRAALDLIRRDAADVAFLDIEMPDLDGLAVAAGASGPERPALVFVTAYQQYAVRAFEVEALDYLLKPLDDDRVAESVRRAARYLRFVRDGPPAIDRFGAVTVDYGRRQVTRDGRRVALRPREYELLVALLRRGGGIAGRTELLREVWGYADSVVSRTVDTHINALRRQLEDDPAAPRHIVTVRHYGYRLEREAPDPGSAGG